MKEIDEGLAGITYKQAADLIEKHFHPKHGETFIDEALLLAIELLREANRPNKIDELPDGTLLRNASRDERSIEIVIGPGGAAMLYDSSHDITIHCTSEEELEKVVKKLKSMKWVPVKESLPEDRVNVLVCYREWNQYSKRYAYTIVIGWHANKYAVREDYFSEWEADYDYCEDDDQSYIPEGWYELTTQGNSDEMNWYLNADVVAWMPLPVPYQRVGEEDVRKPD